MKLGRVIEMTITRDEFLRLLPRAVDHAPFTESPAGFELRAGDKLWRIGFEAMPDLRPGGLIRMRRHRVSFEFEGHSEAEIEARLKRFELYFRRGGG